MIFEKNRAMFLKTCAHVVVPSKCIKQTVLKKTGVRENKLSIVPNWVDMRMLRSPQENEQAHLPLKFRVLYAGSLSRANPIRTMVQAASLLQNEQSDIEFLFIGSGPKFDFLARERARMGLDNIRLLPYQPREKMRRILESGDIHLISMRHSAAGFLFPRRLYDAFSVKRPVVFIGPSESEIKQILHDYQAGVTIPQGRPDLLARTIKHLRDIGEDWHLLHQGAAHAGDVFTPEHSQNKWLKLIDHVVEEK
jgi:glycosyltransferase involved in cell wall biosynthesis